jgi:hypothetical protein
MGDLRADIDSPPPLVQQIEIVRKAFPSPRHAFVQRGSRYVLDAFHQLDQAALVPGTHGREANPAIADDHRGDAMPA